MYTGIKKCKNCLNTEKNPSIKILSSGLCNVCDDYINRFDEDALREELKLLKKLISDDYDCMVALSGGKDSTAMIKSVIDLGFHPIAFTFEIGYNHLTNERIKKIQSIAEKFNIPHEVIDIHSYISNADMASFEKIAKLYDDVENGEITDLEFIKIYKNGRFHYSTKDDVPFAFVRPCQICRKVTIRAYYKEALKRNVKVVFVGINEWASIKESHYSAIRKICPDNDENEVFIVHLPFLLQRRYSEIHNILSDMGVEENVDELDVETGGKCCDLANACEKIAYQKMGFHLDSARLSREITVGFIDRKTAENAIAKGLRHSNNSVRQVLENAGILKEEIE